MTLRKHPKYDCWVANYSPTVQFDRLWTRDTIQCRGLVINEDRVLARPFKKFFNYSELQGLRNHLWNLYGVRYSEIFNKPFTAYEKIDGSLAICFRLPNGKWEWCTRGSFESEQAEKARQIFKDKYKDVTLNPHNTYLFEIIYPENRVVIDYKGVEDLYLLGVVETSSFYEFNYNEITNFSLPFPRPKVYSDLTSLAHAESVVNDYTNFEGFVLDFGEGFRCKMKSEDYVRLHRVMTGFTPRRVFEALRSGAINQYTDNVPDEFYSDVKSITEEVLDKLDIIIHSSKEYYNLICEKKTRKEFAEEAKKFQYPSILFSMLDGKDYTKQAWDILEKDY